MSALHPCSSCERHVRVTETACPFCGTGLALADLPPRPMPTQRLGRAATFAFGAAVAASAAGCGTSTTTGDAGLPSDAYVAADAGTDTGLVAAYGGPPIDASLDTGLVAAYGGPPIDADLPDVWGAALYGAPPVPPEP